MRCACPSRKNSAASCALFEVLRADAAAEQDECMRAALGHPPIEPRLHAELFVQVKHT